MRYDVAPDGSISNGRLFADVTAEKEEGLPDGFKVDSQGNIWSSGPAGIWVFSSEGKHLGTLKTPEIPANCNWGGDGKTLYITANQNLPHQAGGCGRKAPVRGLPVVLTQSYQEQS